MKKVHETDLLQSSPCGKMCLERNPVTGSAAESLDRKEA